MGISLALTVAGLLVAYILLNVSHVDGKTLNAVLCDKLTAGWTAHIGSVPLGSVFVFITLASEAALLIIAAQTGFLDGPRVMSNMALDRWFPTRFANLSDRFVTQNGVLVMGSTALIMMLATYGNVDTLVVLYSINVFITFSLSQLGMVVHWWQVRHSEAGWKHRLAINGFGLVLTLFILISMIVLKFVQGGCVTIVITGFLVLGAFLIKRHYNGVTEQLRRLDVIVEAANAETTSRAQAAGEPDPKARTAIILVNGYNGLGLHTVLQVPRMFGNTFSNFVFIQVGAVDAGNFKGTAEIDALRTYSEQSAQRYVNWARAHGYGAAAFTSVGTDIMGEIMRLSKEAATRFPNNIFFAGQLLFLNETRVTRWLHNHTALALQQRFFLANLPFVVLPIRVG
jgi:hypothetical protein